MEPKKILFVDDEELIRTSLAREIVLGGYDAETATSGDEAVTMLRQGSYDMVITDLLMPGIDGLGVLQATKKMAPEICVIILTGHGDMEKAIEALQLGADDFLTKPCGTEELFFRIARCLEKQTLLRQLAQQNLALKKAVRHQQEVKEKLRQSEERFRLALDASSDGVWDRDLLTGEEYYGDNWYRSLGFTDKDIRSDLYNWQKLLHPEDRKKTLALLHDHIKGTTSSYEAEFRLKNRRGKYQWFLSRGRVVAYDAEGTPLRIVGTHTDISQLKNAEIALQNARNTLEKKVKERTVELEELNIALQVLLQKREMDRATLEQQIAANMSNFIEPYLLKMKGSRLSSKQQMLLDILQTNFQELTSQFSGKLSAEMIRLTPAELQVANFIRQGKQSKEIAELMHLAHGTVSIHRKHIRKKLGLTHKKVNLQSVLSTYL